MLKPRIQLSRKSYIKYFDFLFIQIKEFNKFITLNFNKRKRVKLYYILKNKLSIINKYKDFSITFVDYFISRPIKSINKCLELNVTYNVNIKVLVHLYSKKYNINKYKILYLGFCPYMTKYGSFIFNGSERVVISQLYRPNNIYYYIIKNKNNIKLYYVKIIPKKGIWIEIYINENNICYLVIDKKKKILITTFLKSIGYNKKIKILKLFGIIKNVTYEIYKKNKYRIYHKNKIYKIFNNFKKKQNNNIINNDKISNNEYSNYYYIDKVNYKIYYSIIKTLKYDKIKDYNTYIYKLLSVYLDFISPFNQNCNINGLYNKDDININKNKIKNIIYNKIDNKSSKLNKKIYNGINNKRNNDIIKNNDNIINNLKFKKKYNIFKYLLFNVEKYNLGKLLRYSFNKIFKLKNKGNIFTIKEFILIIKKLIKDNYLKNKYLDIDNLSNKRIKTIYDQLVDLFTIGLNRIKNNIIMKIKKQKIYNIKFSELINSKIITSLINSFFGTHQLSQFMDQTNILSELTHKRRLSLLGTGGISKNRVSFKIRDINNSYYGKICPLETPEGPHIGLVSSLCIFAKLNKFNYLITPYINLKKNNRIEYLNYLKERNKIISTYDVLLRKKKVYLSRYKDNYIMNKYKNINYIDVDYNQIISLTVSQIPFLEHDDANRILMGANMIRQTVPLLYCKSPIVNTSLDKYLIKYSRIFNCAKHKGKIKYVDNKKIIIIYKNKKKKIINLIKYKRTNQNTCLNIKPIVKINDIVKKNQLLCEGYGVKDKEIALGKDVLIAFMPFKGYNFEDAIVVSNRIIEKDYFTSLYIEECIIELKNTKMGYEIFTNNIPNMSINDKFNLDEKGIIKIGTIIKPGDILVGKLTPKGYEILSPERKMLNLLFNKKFYNMKDTSLRAHNNLYGTIIDIKKFKKIEPIKYKNKLKLIKKGINSKIRIKAINISKKIFNILNKCNKKEYIIKKDIKNYKYFYKNINKIHYFYKTTKNLKINKYIYKIYYKFLQKKDKILSFYNKKKFKIKYGHNLNYNVYEIIKLQILKKRILQVGDKMSGRHGNKGVIGKIVKKENMPFLSNGQIIDMVLNPLGVPSRMNVGQLLETILGMIGKTINRKFSVKPFNSISVNKIQKLLLKYNLPKYCKYNLYDGKTGEKYDQKVTVGYMYMLKLNHMVEDKVHARSIGPYSLITQQPLGGRSQFGGQRFGEMEVWALEAFGSACFLRELLTIKSDDIKGRINTYFSIINNKQLPKFNMPESFNVLIKELNGLNIDLLLK
ncbi:MAG: DNA-directed RNA polymerase subunit beta [Candidatus Shikimatogenerans sp. AspAUS03]|uniref:DNA-directed RNA polymerase subunit beta n=1 Tax=Candidatus Shikimatogenerans sp. AspAUS03 TaxID=3158563 RepID=A0AAU7QSN6_9FLAO